MSFQSFSSANDEDGSHTGTNSSEIFPRDLNEIQRGLIHFKGERVPPQSIELKLLDCTLQERRGPSPTFGSTE